MAATLLYDADCGLCRVCVAVVLSWDRRCRLRPVALQAPEADRLLADVVPAQRLDSWHLVEPPGRRHSAGAAFGPLLRLLRGGGAAARACERFPAAAERGYRLVADNRSALGHALPGAARRWADRVIAQREGSKGKGQAERGGGR